MKKEADKIDKLNNNKIHLTDRQKQIYRVILNNPGITTREICQIFGCQRASLYDRMTGMIDSGLLISKTMDNHGTKSFKIDRRKKVIL